MAWFVRILCRMLRFFVFVSSVRLSLCACLILLGTSRFTADAADQPVYTDALQPGWTDYSWATVNLANTSPVHAGADSISVSSTYYEALYLHHSALNASLYTSITFWVNGGTGGQSVQAQATRGGTAQVAVVLAPLPVNSWRQETVSLASLGVATVSDFDGFWLQVQNAGTAPTFYVDDITLVTNANPPAIVTLTSPPSGANFLAPATINLTASVVSNSHSISKVQFYNGSSLLGEDGSPPYNYTWTNVGAANYSLLARVIFDAGLTADSP